MQEEKVISYYLVCNRLKDLIRSGWKNWKVKRNRIESVAEHIFGVQMLAIAMNSEYNYDIDIMKVIYMLAIHELGETIIGDITQFELNKEEKEKIEHEAVHKILGNLIDGDKIEKLFLEFDEKKTKESKFAYQCDKLECDIQCKLYDEEGCVDYNNQKNKISINEQTMKNILNKEKSWSSSWIEFGKKTYNYDENFMKVADYIKNNNINNN